MSISGCIVEEMRMRAMMGRQRCEEEVEVEVGEERMRLKRCHASLGLLVLLCLFMVCIASGCNLYFISFCYITNTALFPNFSTSFVICSISPSITSSEHIQAPSAIFL